MVRRVFCVLLCGSPLGGCGGFGASPGPAAAAGERQGREGRAEQRGEALERHHGKWKRGAMRRLLL